MSLPNLSSASINREKRHAVIASIAIAVMAVLDTLLILTNGQSINTPVALEIAAIIGLLTMAITSAVQSYHGSVGKSIWRLIISIVVVGSIAFIVSIDLRVGNQKPPSNESGLCFPGEKIWSSSI